MSLESIVNDHDEQLIKHEKQIEQIQKDVMDINYKVNDSLVRVEESNKFLREQNTAQIEQNTKIFNAVLNRNEKASEREFELKKMKMGNVIKICLAVFGSGGLVYAVIDIVLNLTLKK